MDSSLAPEDRAMTVRMCKRLRIWPLDQRHKPEGQCLCASCFAGTEVVVELKPKRAKPKAFFWEEDAA